MPAVEVSVVEALSRQGPGAHSIEAHCLIVEPHGVGQEECVLGEVPCPVAGRRGVGRVRARARRGEGVCRRHGWRCAALLPGRAEKKGKASLSAAEVRMASAQAVQNSCWNVECGIWRSE